MVDVVGGDSGHGGGMYLVFILVCCGVSTRGMDFRDGMDNRCGVEQRWLFVTEENDQFIPSMPRFGSDWTSPPGGSRAES